MRIARRETTAVAVGVVLVVAAFVVPHLDLGIVTPLINATPDRFEDFAGTAPIFGWWDAHVGWGTVPAIVIGVAAVLWGPSGGAAAAVAVGAAGRPGRRRARGRSRWR